MIKIRLARGGRIHRPVYTIVAINSRSARDGRFLEKLGQYNPNTKELLHNINTNGINKWLDRGAVLSDTVRSLFKKNNISL